MAALKFGRFLPQVSVLQSKAALLICFPPFLLLVPLALPSSESCLMPTIWYALHWLVSDGPAFAFVLLNCLTAAIIASSKLGSDKERRLEEDSQGELALKCQQAEKVDEKEDEIAGGTTVLERPSDTQGPLVEDRHEKTDDVAESVVVLSSLDLDITQLIRDGQEKWDAVAAGVDIGTSLQNGGVQLIKKRENSLRRRSFDALNKIKQEQLKFNGAKERKPVIRSKPRQLGARRKSSDKVKLHPNKPLIKSSVQDEQLNINSSHGVARVAVDTASHEGTYNEKLTQKIKNVPQPRRQAQINPAHVGAAEDHVPSMDEVWAVIVSSKEGGDGMQEQKRGRTPDSKTAEQPQPAATACMLTQSAAVAGAAIPPPVAASHTADRPKTSKAAPGLTGKACVAAQEKLLRGRFINAEENGGELEKLNHRAEQFIGRFNYQLRLQREASLRCKKRAWRPRD